MLRLAPMRDAGLSAAVHGRRQMAQFMHTLAADAMEGPTPVSALIHPPRWSPPVISWWRLSPFRAAPTRK
jgi:hypothetical protein